MEVDPCGHDGPWPFDDVFIKRERGPDDEPTGWVTIEGLRQGGCREVRVPYTWLWNQMETHMTSNHGKSLDDPMSVEELEHATLRAAVVFLID
jgi:hypothetical protein